LRKASDDVKTNFQSLTVDQIKDYADSDLVKDYYYTLESSLSSSTINPVEDNERPSDAPDDNNQEENNNFDKGHGMDIGDFRITAYSNFAYLSDFTDGTKKITDGSMVTGSSTDDEIVISEDLAEENNLKVDDE